MSEVFNGVDFNANARLGDLIVRGGISTGKVTQDTCAIVVEPSRSARRVDLDPDRPPTPLVRARSRAPTTATS